MLVLCGVSVARSNVLNNDLQNTTQKTLDRATLTPQSTNIRKTMTYKTLHRKHCFVDHCLSYISTLSC
jgi:hypothetical protein